MTPERFAKGMTFDDYVKFTGSPANLGREGFDVRRFSLVRPRVDWSGFLRERHAKARLTNEQAAAIKWLAAQPGGPAKILVLSEDWRALRRPAVSSCASSSATPTRCSARDCPIQARTTTPISW